jgi:PKD repeat protein
MALGLATLVTAAGCTVKDTEAPPLTGPSELGLAVRVTANPDVLTMDGHSQSAIIIETRNAAGQPQGGIGFRVEVVAGGEIRDDVGTLSSKTGSTGGDGRASVTYTAPLSPSSGNSDPGNLTVTIRVVPSGTDYANAVGRSVELRLIPAGQLLPLPNTPKADFLFSPASPTEGQSVQFDASTSRDCPPDATSIEQCPANSPTLVEYAWDFGDGSKGSGVRAAHAYEKAGAYSVTLKVTNQRGYSSTASKFLTVGAAADPTAVFTFSPVAPIMHETVFFNAAASKAAPGRTIVSYRWDFGDSWTGSGITSTHKYDRPSGFVVVLTVTDDLGKKGVATQTVTVK